MRLARHSTEWLGARTDIDPDAGGAIRERSIDEMVVAIRRTSSWARFHGRGTRTACRFRGARDVAASYPQGCQYGHHVSVVSPACASRAPSSTQSDDRPGALAMNLSPRQFQIAALAGCLILVFCRPTPEPEATAAAEVPEEQTHSTTVPARPRQDT